ncbi:MAG: ABC transporter ATP-binding protein [Saccharofermentans sp.]|nr:ABC transporter ATP-binding protein [Saccharofermentans sp.]
MALIKTTNLCKTYVVDKRQNNVLKNVSFSINQGEMVAIMGQSGSGKSTLLYSVSGMDRPTSGEILFDGKDISKLSESELADIRLDKMGFIFQQMYMLKNLTILDNIMLPAIQSKKNNETRQQIEERAMKLMKKLGIEDVADNDINEVSGGQLQRACICRSLINNPDIIFADEPTGALNRTSSTEVMDELVKINNDGATLMMVTHDAKVAARCTKVFFIDDGNIKDQYELGKFDGNPATMAKRERDLNNWLMDLGF